MPRMRQSRPGVPLKGWPPRRTKETGTLSERNEGEGERVPCRKSVSSAVLGCLSLITVPSAFKNLTNGRLLARRAFADANVEPSAAMLSF